MEIWVITAILGTVEGLTEFIPVSSTGHLIVVGNLLGFTGDKASTFEVAIQLGAILAVPVLYIHRFQRLIPRKESAGRSAPSTMDGWSGLWLIAVATFPAGLAGYLGHDFIKSRLFTPATVTWALVVGAIGILIAERFVSRHISRPIDTLTWQQALGVGLFQILALWPGRSRSAATIVGGMLMGLDRKAAAEFSFLIAVPIMAAASGYDLLKMHGSFSSAETAQFLLGFVISFIVAVVSIASFIRILSRWSLAPFAWYRILVAPIFYFLTTGAAF